MTERTEVKEEKGACGCGKALQHDKEVRVFLCSHLPYTQDTSVTVDIHTHYYHIYYDPLIVQMLPSNLSSPWLAPALTDRVVNSINARGGTIIGPTQLEK